MKGGGGVNGRLLRKARDKYDQIKVALVQGDDLAWFSTFSRHTVGSLVHDITSRKYQKKKSDIIFVITVSE